jgi:hypothetical protein
LHRGVAATTRCARGAGRGAGAHTCASVAFAARFAGALRCARAGSARVRPAAPAIQARRAPAAIDERAARASNAAAFAGAGRDGIGARFRQGRAIARGAIDGTITWRERDVEIAEERAAAHAQDRQRHERRNRHEEKGRARHREGLASSPTPGASLRAKTLLAGTGRRCT